MKKIILNNISILSEKGEVKENVSITLPDKGLNKFRLSAWKAGQRFKQAFESKNFSSPVN